MNAYFWFPLVSGLACLAFAVLVLAREPSTTSYRVMAGALASGAGLGIFDALWTVAPDATTALALVRLSTPSWIFLGPLALHLLIDQVGAVRPALRRLVPFAYAFAATLLVLSWSGFPMHSAMLLVPWGWAYRPTAVYAVWVCFTVGCASLGYVCAIAGIRRSDSPADRGQIWWLLSGIGLPLVLSGLTDGLFPIFDIQVPRTGSACFAVLGAFVTWTRRRFGYSVLVPGSFAAPILASLRDGVALATPGGRVRFANPALAGLLQTSVVDLIDEPLAAFLPDETFAPPRELRELECDLHGLGDAPIPVSLSTSLLRDSRGRLIGLVLVMRDLREVVGLRKGLLTSARLAAVGQLAAGIAHEINNPLAYIGTNLRALREHWLQIAASWRAAEQKPYLDERFDEGIAMLDESLEGVERTAAIVRDVRAFSHGGSDVRERLDPNQLLERALRVAEPHLRRRARVDRFYDSVPQVEGSRRELEQVLLNLLINAAQAIGGGGGVRVSTALHGDEVEITVSDNGCGIPGELLERIFDPFFTTKPVGEGTGLGLSISHEIVRRHGGRILVDSEVGRGTDVRIRLPAA